MPRYAYQVLRLGCVACAFEPEADVVVAAAAAPAAAVVVVVVGLVAPPELQ
jgi:hypothetical protein